MGVAAVAIRDDHYTAAVEKQSFDGSYSVPSVIVTLSVALALYNSLEMVLLISSTFKRWRGLYFWSLSSCNLGVLLYAIGIMMGYFHLGVLWLGKTLLDIGWMLMIACQALVLYSRLGLILDSPKILSAVKWMIIAISVVVLPATVVLDFGTTYSGMSTFARAYFYIEHIQMTTITLQELIISGLYVWKTLNFLQVVGKAHTRGMIWQLFTINVIIIAMDIAIVVLQYKHFQLYQESIKGFVYSVKLKLELNILSKLVDLVHGNASNRSMTLDVVDSHAIAGQAQAEVRQELQGVDYFTGRVTSNEKGMPQVRDGDPMAQARFESQQNGSLDENGALTQVTSHPSLHTARTSGRESDILYADFLRDLK